MDAAKGKTARPPFKFVDLCCGVGAFHIVLKELGGSCVLACDRDKNVKLTYQANHGDDFEWHDDLKTIEALPKHDVFCAGFPCTTYSVAGLREGTENRDQGTIIFKIMSLLRGMTVRPRVVLLENVIGLLSIHNGRTLNYVMSQLSQMGYNVVVNSYDAVEFGAPVHRERVIICGMRGFTGDITPDAPRKKLHLKDVLEAKPEGKPGHTWLAPERYVMLPKEDWYTSNEKIFVGYLKEKSYKSKKLEMISAHRQAERIYHIDGVSETMTAQHKYPIYLPRVKRVRFLTPREMFSAMGFPTRFKISDKSSVAIRQVSNSICIFMLRPVVKAIIQVFNAHRAR